MPKIYEKFNTDYSSSLPEWTWFGARGPLLDQAVKFGDEVHFRLRISVAARRQKRR